MLRNETPERTFPHRALEQRETRPYQHRAAVLALAIERTKHVEVEGLLGGKGVVLALYIVLATTSAGISTANT